MTVANRLLIAASLALLCVPSAGNAGSAEIRHSAGAWTTVCRLGGGYCTASARLPARETGRAYEHLLRLSRATPTDAPEIALLIAGPRPRSDASITIQVEGKEAHTLAPGSGYRATASSGTYILDTATTATLLEELKHGKRVELRYDTQDAPAKATFTLVGFPDALAFLERTQGAAIQGASPKSSPAPGAAARAEVGPATEPTHADVMPPTQARPANEPLQTDGLPPKAQAEPEPVVAPLPKTASLPSAAPLQSVIAEPKPAAAPQTAPSAPLPKGRRRVAKLVRQFTCRASEPFWNLSIDNSSARFVSLAEGGEPQAVVLTGKLGVTGEGRTPDVDWRGKSEKGASYRALISEAPCFDPASSKEGQPQYDYRVQLTMPNRKTLSGCCNAGLDVAQAQPAPNASEVPVADLSSKGQEDWSRLLLDLLPALEACLEKTPGPSAYVTKAWPMNRGMIGTRTRNRDGGWFECVASNDGRTVEHIEMLPKASPPLPGEQLVVFTAPAQAPPAGSCYRTEQVQDAAGKLVGWLSSNGC